MHLICTPKPCSVVTIPFQLRQLKKVRTLGDNLENVRFSRRRYGKKHLCGRSNAKSHREKNCNLDYTNSDYTYRQVVLQSQKGEKHVFR